MHPALVTIVSVMDQDSFRRLLQTPRPGSALQTATTSASKINLNESPASKPAFKPRKVKKETGANTLAKYRDRAAERRLGKGNDYAQVEAVLEGFERRAANAEDKVAFENQRHYLGGDADHSILVKGLDVALLEQNKMRAANEDEDGNDVLEQALLKLSADADAPSIPKKRTREDIVRDLREKRQQGGNNQPALGSVARITEEEAAALEQAKKAGKFKPIASKHSLTTDRGKKKKAKDKDGSKKKQRKHDGADITGTTGTVSAVGADSAAGSTKQTDAKPLPPPPHLPAPPLTQQERRQVVEPEPGPDPDFDIFAGVPEYEGIVDDGDDLVGDPALDAAPEPKPFTISTKGNWFEQETSVVAAPPEPEPPKEPQPQAAPPPEDEAEDAESEPLTTRLVPLASSALPSIRDFLALDKAAQTGKKKKRKDKKGADGGARKVNVEAKVERDYKRLKAYTEDKKGS